jgi:hypothetical protein
VALACGRRENGFELHLQGSQSIADRPRGIS